MPASSLQYVVGSRVRATASIPYAGFALIKQGERGTIMHDEWLGDERITTVCWDQNHEGLAWCDNETTLHTGDIHLAPLPREWLRRPRSWTPRLMASAILLAFALGWVLEDEFDVITTLRAETNIRVRSSRLLTPTIRLGAPLWVELEVQQGPLKCKGPIDRAFTNYNGVVPVVLHQQPFQFKSLPNSDKRTIGVPVPLDFVPGHYAYRATASVECEDGRQYQIDTGQMEFDLLS